MCILRKFPPFEQQSEAQVPCQGATQLSQAPIWLLGTWYGATNHDKDSKVLIPEVLKAFHQDFGSRIWCTYRKDFPAIGETNLTSDIGWGCTLRSGQMLLAEALLRHTMGREWLREPQSPLQQDVLDVLSLLLDSAVGMLSIHSICDAGKEHGVVPGKWLGPWALCKSLESLVNAMQPMGIWTYVVCDPGGGAPTLDVHRIRKTWQAGQPAQGIPATTQQEQDTAAASNEAAAAAAASTSGQHAIHQQDTAFNKLRPASNDPDCSGGRPLLLLIPLTVGVDKVSPLYYPQLQQVLTYPQTVGIIGGRPSASLFFVGHQDDNLIYLDPHESQLTAKLPDDAHTYFCDMVRLMPIGHMDPSLAIGFYCKTMGDFDDLCDQLQLLCAEHKAAPIMTVATEELQQHVHEFSSDAAAADDTMQDNTSQARCSEGQQHEDWEML